MNLSNLHNQIRTGYMKYIKIKNLYTYNFSDKDYELVAKPIINNL